MSSYYRQQLEDYLKTLDIKADRVLDIGGASNPVKGRVKSWDVKHYEIWDNGQENGHFDKFIDLQCVPDRFSFVVDEQAQVVFCLEVFEYIYNPVLALQNLHALVKRGGDLYITFSSLYPPHNPIKTDYLRYTKQGAVKLLEEAGFKVDKITPRVIHDKEAYKHYIAIEKYKCQGAIDVGTLYDAGYIIKCRKI